MSDLERLHNNSLNSSSSKQQYSFNKEARFKEHLKTEGADRYYEVPSSRKNMAFSFGKLARCELNRFGKGTQSPPPGSYEIEGSLDKLLKKKEGVKVMYGREVHVSRLSNVNLATSSGLRTTPDQEPITLTLRLQRQDYRRLSPWGKLL